MSTNAIQWFEIPVLDFQRAKTFYSALLAFDMQEMQMGTETMGFLPCEPDKGVGGALVFGNGYVPSRQGTVVYLSCGPDLALVLGRVVAAGGEVLVEKTQISPEHGFYAHFLDSEGNRIGLYSLQ